MVASAAEISATIGKNQARIFEILNECPVAGETQLYFTCSVGTCPARIMVVKGNFHHDPVAAYGQVSAENRPHCEHGAMQVPRFAQP